MTEIRDRPDAQAKRPGPPAPPAAPAKVKVKVKAVIEPLRPPISAGKKMA